MAENNIRILLAHIKLLLNELEHDIRMLEAEKIYLEEELAKRKKSKTGWDLFFKIFGNTER